MRSQTRSVLGIQTSRSKGRDGGFCFGTADGNVEHLLLRQQPLAEPEIRQFLDGRFFFDSQRGGDSCALAKDHPRRLDADRRDSDVRARQDHGHQQIRTFIRFGQDRAVRNAVAPADAVAV